MRTFRSFFALIAALLPVLYCGGLLYYFGRFSSATGGLFDRSLSPTRFGLAAVGLIFVLLFALKVWRMARPPAPPRSCGGLDADEPKSDFDPDAALARYMARRNAAPLRPEDRPPPGSFGRKRA